jgi:hypothetical protein
MNPWMMDQRIVQWIESKFQGLADELTERARRRWAAVEAVALGRGGISVVSAATGLAHTTLRRGIRELGAGDTPPGRRQRRAGAGRKVAEAVCPGLKAALEGLVEPESRGDPMSPLRWTCKGTRRLAAELTKQGYAVGPTTVRRLLKAAGYSLQANRKTREGRSHPDRDAQFRYINGRIQAQQRRGQPAVSVDTKKKETLGNLKNPGQTWRRKGRPREVDTHDFSGSAQRQGRPLWHL